MKTHRKPQKNSPKNTTILNIKMSTGGGPAFTLSLPGEGRPLPPVS